jgi:hypothetical protein
MLNEPVAYWLQKTTFDKEDQLDDKGTMDNYSE